MAKRKRGGHPARHTRPAPLPAGAVSTYEGIPVYDGTMCVEVRSDFPGRPTGDRRVLLGIGPEDGLPVAFVVLCPCEGVQGLVADLQEVAAAAAEHHPPHTWPGSWERRVG